MERRNHYRYFIAVFTLLVLPQLFLVTLQAQGTTYLVSIYVKDLSGEPVEGAQVQIYQGAALINEGLTNPLGKSSFYLETGLYDILVKKRGFKDSYAEVDVSGVTMIDIYLEVGSGSLDDTGLIYFVFAAIGTFTAIFSAWIGYNAYKYQQKHQPAKFLKKIIEGRKR